MDTKQIDRQIGSIFNRFRELAGATSTGRYVLVLLFTKYLTDCWRNAYQQYAKKYGNDDELIRRKMARERFVLSEEYCFDRLVTQKNDPALGHHINKVLTGIEKMNSDRLDGVLRHVDFNSDYALGGIRERNRFLAEVIAVLEQFDLSPSANHQKEWIAAWLLNIGSHMEISASRGDVFFTPADIVQLLVRLMEPKAGERLYDPVCGSGSLLIAAAGAVQDASGHLSANYALYGQEVNKERWAWANINLYLAGLDNVRLAIGDVLTQPAWKEGDNLMKFDVILANPPFSAPTPEALQYTSDPWQRFHWGTPPRNKADYAFIQHIIASIAYTGGRAAIVVPQGVLFREGKEGAIRKNIIGDNWVEAIIALPSNLFLFTSVPCAIMVLNKGKRDRKEILFINAAGEFVPGKRRNTLNEDHITRIITAYKAFKQGEAGAGAGDNFSRCVPLAELAANNYTLSVSRYLHTHEAEEKPDVLALQNDVAALEKRLLQLKTEIEKEKKELGL